MQFKAECLDSSSICYLVSKCYELMLKYNINSHGFECLIIFVSELFDLVAKGKFLICQSGRRHINV